jgi:glycosyltransferase involved in cell wall biosynthesis
MESHLQALCTELKRRVNVEVVVSNEGRRTIEEIVDGIKVTRVGTLFNLAAAPVCPETVRVIRESKADLVHIHLPHPTAILAYLASGHRGRLVFTYHSDIIRQKVLSKLFWPILSYALNRADAIIVASPNYLESSHVLQEFKSRCRVIPFGIPLKGFDQVSSTEVANICEQFGPRIVLGVGRLIYYKGFEYLIRAMKDVEGHLLLVGTGPLHNELKLEAERSGVSTRVSFLGNVADVTPYYHAASAFALPSIARSEAFGIVQLEAMACRTPVVNTRLDSGVTFVSVDGVTGLTDPPADPRSLAEALNTLLDSPDLGSGYGQAGRQRVEAEFSLEVMTQRTLNLYLEVMNSGNKFSTY